MLVDAGLKWMVDFLTAVAAGNGFFDSPDRGVSSLPASTRFLFTACEPRIRILPRPGPIFSPRIITPTACLSFRKVHPPTTRRTQHRLTAGRDLDYEISFETERWRRC